MLKSWLLLGGLLLFGLLWWFTYPPAFQIADEKAYIEQAIALSEGHYYNEFHLAEQLDDYNPKNYPVGTAFLLAILVLLGGKWAVFSLGPLCYLGALYASYTALRQLRLPWQALYVLAFFLPLLVLSRHVMSELPALLLVATFVALLSWPEPSWHRAFWIGLLALVGLLFRETLVLLTLPLVAQWAWQQKPATKTTQWLPTSTHIWAAAGAAFAIALKAGSSTLFYGSPYYVKDPGIDFSLSAVLYNLPYYAIGLLVLLPGGLLLLYRYRGWQWQSVLLALGLYLCFHLVYGYHGQGAESGPFGGFLLTMRFLIPSLPLFILLYGSALARQPLADKTQIALVLVGILLLLCVYWMDYQKGLAQRHRVDQLKAEKVERCTSKKYYEYCTNLYD